MSDIGALFELGTSPRLQGVGGVGLSFASGPEVSYYNPARLGRVDSWYVSSGYASHYAGVSFGTLGFSSKYVGVHLIILDSGPIVGADRTIRYLTEGLAVGVGGDVVPNTVGCGVRVRYLHTTMPSKNSAWTLDPCVAITLGGLQAGVMLEGLWGSGLPGSRGTETPWRQQVSAGLGYGYKLGDWLSLGVAVELRDAFGPDREIAAGIECDIERAAFRIGFDGLGITAGISFRWDEFQLDGCYISRADLGASSRASISWDIARWLAKDSKGHK